jgi:hypothetical protein
MNCLICETTWESPDYSDCKCPKCGQQYVYHEDIVIELSAKQIDILRTARTQESQSDSQPASGKKISTGLDEFEKFRAEFQKSVMEVVDKFEVGIEAFFDGIAVALATPAQKPDTSARPSQNPQNELVVFRYIQDGKSWMCIQQPSQMRPDCDVAFVVASTDNKEGWAAGERRSEIAPDGAAFMTVNRAEAIDEDAHEVIRYLNTWGGNAFWIGNFAQRSSATAEPAPPPPVPLDIVDKGMGQRPTTERIPGSNAP